MFYKTFNCLYVNEAKPLCFSLCSQMLMMFSDATFKMFVTQMSSYLFVISLQLMFYKTLRYRLARDLGQTAHNKGIIQAGDFIAPESLWSILKHFLSRNKQIYASSYVTVVNICLWKGTFTLQLLHETWGNISLHLRSCVVLEVQ